MAVETISRPATGAGREKTAQERLIDPATMDKVQMVLIREAVGDDVIKQIAWIEKSSGKVREILNNASGEMEELIERIRNYFADFPEARHNAVDELDDDIKSNIVALAGMVKAEL